MAGCNHEVPNMPDYLWKDPDIPTLCARCEKARTSGTIHKDQNTEIDASNKHKKLSKEQLALVNQNKRLEETVNKVIGGGGGNNSRLEDELPSIGKQPNNLDLNFL